MTRSRLIGALGAILLAFFPSVVFAQASQLPPGEVCFSANSGISGMVGLLGTITGGTGGTSGTYGGVALTGGSGTGATANITVSGGAVTAIAILNPGTQYVVGDTLSAASGNIGSVSGFSVPVSSISINSSLAGGSVGMYIPSTLTFKQTWKNANQSTLNTNPITLDSNGCAIMYGAGTYRQILSDSLGNVVWDQPTSVAPVNPFWAGTAGGTANAITVTDASFAGTDGQQICFIAAHTNTGATTLNPSAFGAISIVKNSSAGPVALSGGEIVTGNSVCVIYGASANEFFLQGALVPAQPWIVQGRLTLTTAVPVLTSTVSAATTIIFTPCCGGNSTPVWNGSTFVPEAFTELSQTLVSTTFSPAAAVASTCYDMFVWQTAAGANVLSRGNPWSSETVRGAGSALARVSGLYVNGTSITNGPATNTGVFVGSICTNSGATVDYIFGAAGAGGTAASFGVSNFYNKVRVSTTVQDTNAAYVYNSATIRQADGSTGNQVSFVNCDITASDSTVDIVYTQGFSSTYQVTEVIGIGVDSTTAFTGAQAFFEGPTSGVTQSGTAAVKVGQTGLLGFHTIAALEQTPTTSGTKTFNFGSGVYDGLTVTLMQ